MVISNAPQFWRKNKTIRWRIQTLSWGGGPVFVALPYRLFFLLRFFLTQNKGRGWSPPSPSTRSATAISCSYVLISADLCMKLTRFLAIEVMNCQCVVKKNFWKPFLDPNYSTIAKRCHYPCRHQHSIRRKHRKPPQLKQITKSKERFLSFRIKISDMSVIPLQELKRPVGKRKLAELQNTGRKNTEQTRLTGLGGFSLHNVLNTCKSSVRYWVIKRLHDT